MNFIYLFAAIIAVLAGFIGLIVIIKGFVDKSNKNIQLGTILVSIGLIIALSGGFCIGMRAAKFAKFQIKSRHLLMEKSMKECDFDMMKHCTMGDSMSMDSNCMKICIKGTMDKKCQGMCKHKMH
jgi:hypothetical protein